MSSKAVLRFLIGCVIAGLFLIFLLPAIGVPKSYLFPSPVIYGQAKGKALGFVNQKKEGGNPNPFKTTETMHYITYRFAAEPPKNLIEKPTPEEVKKKRKVYVGRANVPQGYYENAKIGDNIPVRYEVTRPDISGVTIPDGSMNDQGGAVLLGSWLLFVLGILVLGYAIAPLLQLVILREDY